MKKRNLIAAVMAFILMLALTACGGKEVQNALTMVQDQDIAHIEMSFDAKGDIITKITQTGTLDLSKLPEENIKQLEDTVAKASEQYAAIKGVEYSSEITDDKLVEVIVIPADKDTLKAVSDAGMLPIQGNASRLSLSKTKESLEKSGWTVKEAAAE